ncbi:ABC transporter ATP-binding protein [Roseateles cavernae]|uniref:ABC transporter ATP-binding protein n=1 Tax=Roseateles cavernae TaxID=3153578 RepID=UPI0032E36972
MLSLRHLNKRYGTQPVLRGIALDVAAGEFISLLGPSGCGKTTLLRLICGIEAADSGSIVLNGQDITAWPAAQRRFGVVFQSYALFPNLSLADNVAYGLQQATRGERAARVAELLELVGLADKANKFPAQLSGGQQQRVALARALAPRPPLLLLDEPLSALDAQVRQGLRAEIRRLQQRLGITTIMVTHDQDEALSMADRVVVMHQGQIEQQGSPQQLYAAPATPFVAGFVGKMNLLPGLVTGAGRARVGTAELACASTSFARYKTGSPVLLGLRPECLRLHGQAGTNRLPVSLVEAMFLGHCSLLRLRCEALDAQLELQLATEGDAQLPAWLNEGPLWVELPPEAVSALDTPLSMRVAA